MQWVSADALAEIRAEWGSYERSFQQIGPELPHQPVHHDLIGMPVRRGKPGIYWLRLFRGENGHIGVITEVPGNPSASVMNAIGDIAAWVETQFGIAPGSLEISRSGPEGQDRGEIHRSTGLRSTTAVPSGPGRAGLSSPHLLAVRCRNCPNMKSCTRGCYPLVAA